MCFGGLAVLFFVIVCVASFIYSLCTSDHDAGFESFVFSCICGFILLIFFACGVGQHCLHLRGSSIGDCQFHNVDYYCDSCHDCDCQCIECVPHDTDCQCNECVIDRCDAINHGDTCQCDKCIACKDIGGK